MRQCRGKPNGNERLCHGVLGLGWHRRFNCMRHHRSRSNFPFSNDMLPFLPHRQQLLLLGSCCPAHSKTENVVACQIMFGEIQCRFSGRHQGCQCHSTLQQGCHTFPTIINRPAILQLTLPTGSKHECASEVFRSAGLLFHLIKAFHEKVVGEQMSRSRIADVTGWVCLSKQICFTRKGKDRGELTTSQLQTSVPLQHPPTKKIFKNFKSVTLSDSGIWSFS